MKILVCEDELATREKNIRVIEAAAKSERLTVEINSFENAEQLLFALPEMGLMDLLVLDIQLTGLNGMDLAKEIRKKNHRVAILFVSNYDDYVFDGYEVNAMGYVMKPLTKEKMAQLLVKLVEQQLIEEAFLMVEFNQMPIKIYLYDIIYIESIGHYIQIVTHKKQYQCKGTLQKMIGELPDNFIQVHRSYVVNLNYILAIHQKDVLLPDDTTIPVSRNQKRKVKELFLAHYRGMANE